MKKNLQLLISFVLSFAIIALTCVGLQETWVRLQAPDFRHQEVNRTVFLEPEAASLTPSFIDGPVASNVGELCVFKLSDPEIRADWVVIRQIDKETPTPFYIDTSGSALAFSSSIAAKYTIVASV